MPNIALIGAGSASFSLDLLQDVVMNEGLQGSTMTLVDIDAERLQIAHDLASRYRDEASAEIGFRATTDRKVGLEDADFVICAVKVGGYGPLEAERAIAEAHGYYRGIGDRVSCYYGGIGAYHQLAFLMDLARDMEEICPDAWLIQTANPVFEGTNLITRETNVRAVGVCHGHFGYRAIARTLGLVLDSVSAHMSGFNHYIFLTHFLYKGADAYPLLDRWIEEESALFWQDGEYPEQMSPGAVDGYRLYGLFPIGDAVRAATPWWHHVNFEAKQQWYGKSGGFDSEFGWARYLDAKPVVHDTMARLASASDVSLLEELPLKGSGEQHIQIIAAIANDEETILQLNVPNNGALAGIPDDVLVEIPCVVNGRGIQGVQVGALPPLVMNNVMLPRLARLENILYAYLANDRRPLLLSLMDDPRTQTLAQAEGLLDALFAQPWNESAAKHYR